MDKEFNYFTIPFSAIENSKEGTLNLELLYYYCKSKDMSMCVSRSVIFNIPIQIVNKGKDKIIIKDKI